jgi:competence protein ComEA
VASPDPVEDQGWLVAPAAPSEGPLSPPQQHGLLLLLTAAVLALGISLVFTSPRRAPTRVDPSTPIELADAVVIMPVFHEGTSAGLVVNLNTATADELTSLSGVGPVLAQRIVAYREEHGPFATPEDVLAVSGIGPATLAGFRDRVTVADAAKEDADSESGAAP